MINLLENHYSIIEMITVQETVMTLISVVLAISIGFLVNWDYTKFVDNESIVAYFLIGGIIASLGYGYRPRIEKFFGKYEKFNKINVVDNYTKSPFPILPEFRNDYHDHVEGLFKEIKKNLIPSIKDQNYFEALRKTQEKKHMILQHLRTMINRSDIDSNMFVMYQVAITEFNDLEKRKKTVLREIEYYDEKLDSYTFGHNKGEWIDYNDFKIAIGIKRNDSIEDIFKDRELYNFPSSINCNLYVKDDGNEFRLGCAGHWFAKSEDKEKLEQFKKFIYENGHKIMHEVSSIHSTYGTIDKTSVVWFNKEFKERDEELEGQPILGACRTCLGWFNIENGKKYKPILDVFNSSPFNYDETLWTKEKISGKR